MATIDEQTGGPQENQTPSQIAAAFQREHPEWTGEVAEAFGETTITVPREYVVAACEFLKQTPELEFKVNYHLFSTTKHHRLRLKVVLNEDDVHVPTVAGVWRTANWHERETYDLFGIVFDGHPDLRRILLPDDWQGHALRKDFPLRGYEPYSLK